MCSEKLANFYVVEMNFVFSFHLLGRFLKKAVIQDPGSDKVDNFQDSRQKSSQACWQCFYCQCMPTQKAVSPTVVRGSFLHQGSKTMDIAKPHRCSFCALSYQDFSSKLSFPWKETFHISSMSLALVIFKEDLENRQCSSVL